MALQPNTRLGPYEILAPLGEGGMGEVYRARDTRLDREVAIKILSAHLAERPELRARFEREARTVSSLNHPHICTLFDVGREGETDFLVMELIEGETLAARLARGALSHEEALRIGIEIADALDRAHRAGVVHRDLKPGNVMLTRGGAKLMDFGLARATQTAEPGSGTFAATLPHALTGEGMLVGTAPYMAPEQLQGSESSERSDIWALGCVLYEMATGTRAFASESQASLIKAILADEPTPISQRVATSPPALDRLIQACLAKDPLDRIQSAHDVKLQLQWIRDGGSQAGVPAPVAHRRKNRERLAWSLAAVTTVIAAAALFLLTRPTPQSPALHAFLPPPEGVLYSSSVEQPLPLAISPDGTTIAFCARRGQGPDMLWVRSLDAENARPLAGTEGAHGPFFSPDGRSVAFYADSALRRVDVAGGPVIELANDVDPRGGSWNAKGQILLTTGSQAGIYVVSADGGPLTPVTTLDESLDENTHRYPQFLPDGEHFLYLSRRSNTGAGRSPTIYAGKLGSAERTAVLEVASNVMYASGHLIYVRGTVLMAQRFEVGSLQLEGGAVPLVDDLRMDERFSRGVFAVSNNGVLVCMTGNDESRTQLRWLDRNGQRLGDVGEAADYTYGGTPQISPNGKSVVIAIANRDRGSSDVWLVELDSGRRRKLTVDTFDHPFAIWMPDGRTVAVTTNAPTGGGIDLVAIDGTSTRNVVEGTDYSWPMSAVGDELVYIPNNPSDRTSDLLVIPISGAERTPQDFATTGAQEFCAQFSPDGRFVAYVSTETGRPEVFVAAYPQPGGRWQLSQSGGGQPRWSRDGRELFYLDRDNFLTAVEVQESDAGFRAGAAQKLFQFHASSGNYWNYDVAPDRQRFLVTAPLEKNLMAPLTVLSDWTRKLEER